ncbi:unnamed protein product [Oikopleura dioica]|uniref:Uncharacterized protein n=1 Tax=Oikopleura dioica TaxID=34765 RepID=E4Y9Z0_OIKDI|nr:unnamed protein product [Oikopleura dioica]
MTEILKTVASIKLSSTFLLKSYFMKRPLTMLMGLYFFIVFGTGYVVFALERRYGTCMMYLDVVWLMATHTDNVDQAINKEFMIDDTALATKQITSKLDMLEKIVSKKSKRRKRLIKEFEDSKIANKEETSSIGGEKKLTNQKTLSRSSSVQSRKRWRKAKMISKIAFLTKSKTGAVVKKASEVTSKVGSRFVSTITSRMPSRRGSLEKIELDSKPLSGPQSSRGGLTLVVPGQMNVADTNSTIPLNRKSSMSSRSLSNRHEGSVRIKIPQSCRREKTTSLDAGNISCLRTSKPLSEKSTSYAEIDDPKNHRRQQQSVKNITIQVPVIEQKISEDSREEFSSSAEISPLLSPNNQPSSQNAPSSEILNLMTSIKLQQIELQKTIKAQESKISLSIEKLTHLLQEKDKI